VNINSLIDQAESKLTERVSGLEGSLGTLDATLQHFGDYSITLSCISLLNPNLIIENGCPIAKFPGSSNTLPIDCFYVDICTIQKLMGKNLKFLNPLELHWHSHGIGYLKNQTW
jgi:hypothetical protein